MNRPKLGFGTSGIMGAAITDGARLQLLEHAFEHGILHFDTAPLYGQGDAERVLGKFIGNKRDRVSVVTKFGLVSRQYPSWSRPLKPLVRYLNRRRLDQSRKQQTVQAEFRLPIVGTGPLDNVVIEQSDEVPAYKTDDITKSLNTSLKKLQTDYVDAFLMHDCLPGHFNDEVVQLLLDIKESGKALNVGLASGRKSSLAIIRKFPMLSGVVQVPCAPYEYDSDGFASAQRLLVTHSVFQQDFQALVSWLLENDSRISSRLFDGARRKLSAHQIASGYLMSRAVKKNPNGVTLFSSSRLERISYNSRILDNDAINQELADQLELLAV